ncbi:MAG: hypothetical protein QOG49_1452, partial [Frankiaceae bacterium]|nr:hypothetical protein [Frankiaceae bacterium]
MTALDTAAVPGPLSDKRRARDVVAAYVALTKP